LGLELNLLAIIPLLKNNNSNSANACIKYFLIQAFSSYLLIFRFFFNNFRFSYILIIIRLLLKIGVRPLHQ